MSSVARRVARNSGIRAGAELVGKFATLALMAVLARSEGPAGLGVLVLALAWTEVASAPIDMGFDRIFLRLVARDRAQLDRAFFNVLVLKGRRAVPVVIASLALVVLLDYDSETVTAVALLTVAFLFDAVGLTLYSAFNGLERADLVARALVTQRLVAAALGLIAVLLGYGVVGVAVAFVVAAAIAVGVGFRLLARHIGMPRFHAPVEAREDLRRGSNALGLQEFLSIGMARLDAILLSVLATPAVVGLYGAAYRLLEATLFVSIALLGSFSAMYTYLDAQSDPTIRTAFSRSLKLSFVLLLPCAIALGVLPGPILGLLFGARYEAGAGTLRLLAPTVVILGIVMLCASLIASRLDPRTLMRSFAVAFVVNLVANLLLIPSMGGEGAALSMLICEVVLLAVMMRHCVRAVGAPRLGATAGGGVVAGLAMAVTLLVAHPAIPVLIALPAGGLVYAAVFAAVEQRVAPADLEVIRNLFRDRLGSRSRARVGTDPAA